MSDPSPNCESKRIIEARKRFMCYGALSIALAVGFGYSMASIKQQDTMASMSAKHQEVLDSVMAAANKERASLHNRYMRQLGKKDKEIAAILSVCRPGVEQK